MYLLCYHNYNLPLFARIVNTFSRKIHELFLTISDLLQIPVFSLRRIGRTSVTGMAACHFADRFARVQTAPDMSAVPSLSIRRRNGRCRHAAVQGEIYKENISEGHFKRNPYMRPHGKAHTQRADHISRPD